MLKMLPACIAVALLLVGCGVAPTEQARPDDNTQTTDVIKQATSVTCAAGGHFDCSNNDVGTQCLYNPLGRIRYGGTCQIDPNGNGTCYCVSYWGAPPPTTPPTPPTNPPGNGPPGNGGCNGCSGTP